MPNVRLTYCFQGRAIGAGHVRPDAQEDGCWCEIMDVPLPTAARCLLLTPWTSQERRRGAPSTEFTAQQRLLVLVDAALANRRAEALYKQHVQPVLAAVDAVVDLRGRRARIREDCTRATRPNAA